MKTIQISDELNAKLKNFVVDPFDDTPDSVISRLIEIAEKAKGKWSAWEVEKQQNQKQTEPQEKKSHYKQEKHKEPAENLSYL